MVNNIALQLLSIDGNPLDASIIKNAHTADGRSLDILTKSVSRLMLNTHLRHIRRLANERDLVGKMWCTDITDAADRLASIFIRDWMLRGKPTDQSLSTMLMSHLDAIKHAAEELPPLPFRSTDMVRYCDVMVPPQVVCDRTILLGGFYDENWAAPK